VHTIKKMILGLLLSLGTALFGHFHGVESFLPQRISLGRNRSRIKKVSGSGSSRAFGTSTALGGKYWDRLEIREESKPEWYVLNCIVCNEKMLLAQCEMTCKDLPKEDVVRFVVPTERMARSHGKRNVVDDIVLYPGYVFAKVRLCERVYEPLQNLIMLRSWMASSSRQKGYKKLPARPFPLTEEEISTFRGLEDKMEEKAKKEAQELMQEYEGFQVGQYVKVVKGKFMGEEGEVKRLKLSKISVRMYTYGTSFDHWFPVEELKAMTDEEVMRGLDGPVKPINQDLFDESRGVGKRQKSFDNKGGKAMRSALMGGVKGARPDRNRRQDRVQRGERGNDRLTNEQQMRQEKDTWEKYKSKQIEIESSDAKSKSAKPNVRSKEELALDGYGDFSDFSTGATSSDDDFFNSLMSDLASDLDDKQLKASSPPPQKKTARPSQEKTQQYNGKASQEEDDFFASLMSDLSESLDDAPADTDGKLVDNSDEDEFFAALKR